MDTGLHVVTGAFGYTGRWIAHQLLEKGEKVRTLTNAIGRDDPFDGQVEVHPLDFEIEPQVALVFVFITIIIFIGPFLQLVMWIWLVAMPGTEGDNKFGPESQASVHSRIYK